MISIREVTRRDAAIVGALIGGLLRELRGEEGAARTAMPAELVDRVLALKDKVFGYLAFDADTPVGIIMLSETAAIYANGIFGTITELYVTPGYRSSGIAKLLIAAARSLGIQRGWGRLEVGAPDQPKWQRTLAFYLNYGFAEIGPRLRLLLPA